MFDCAEGPLRAPSAQSNMNFKNKVTVLNIMRKGGFFTNRFSDARRLHQAVIFATGIAIEHASLFVEHGFSVIDRCKLTTTIVLYYLVDCILSEATLVRVLVPKLPDQVCQNLTTINKVQTLK